MKEESIDHNKLRAVEDLIIEIFKLKRFGPFLVNFLVTPMRAGLTQARS